MWVYDGDSDARTSIELWALVTFQPYSICPTIKMDSPTFKPLSFDEQDMTSQGNCYEGFNTCDPYVTCNSTD